MNSFILTSRIFIEKSQTLKESLNQYDEIFLSPKNKLNGKKYLTLVNNLAVKLNSIF